MIDIDECLLETQPFQADNWVELFDFVLIYLDGSCCYWVALDEAGRKEVQEVLADRRPEIEAATVPPSEKNPF